MKQWQIWLRWQRAFRAGEVPQSSYPGFGGKDETYDALGKELKARYLVLVPLQRPFCAVFRVVESCEITAPGVMRELEVEWQYTSQLG